MSYPMDPAKKARDEKIDAKARELLKSEPYLQRLSQENAGKAYKESLSFAQRMVDGKPVNIPAI